MFRPKLPSSGVQAVVQNSAVLCNSGFLSSYPYFWNDFTERSITRWFSQVPNDSKERETRPGKRSWKMDCGKRKETGGFLSIDPYMMETMPKGHVDVIPYWNVEAIELLSHCVWLWSIVTLRYASSILSIPQRFTSCQTYYFMIILLFYSALQLLQLLHLH